jgi:hypothetical protein
MWNDALPRQGITNWQTFYAAQSATTTDSWQSWMKPAGCSWIYIFCQASGGGGGRPNNGSISVGGGGGATGGTTRMLIPAFMVPDILYVRPGSGGAGATTANTAGSIGVTSHVSMAANTTTANLLLGQAGGSGGAASTTGGTAGVAGTTNPAMVGVSLFTTVVGATGRDGASANDGNGVSITQTGASLTTPGAGGGNGFGSGGSIVNNVVFPTISGGATEVNGSVGFQEGAIIQPGLKSFPMIFSGGSGGGGTKSGGAGGTAGSGGNASYGGGGGGGGGGGNSGSTSGNGGSGGDGFILIGAF